MNYLFFDCETNGLPKKYNAPASDIDNWPRMLQLAYILTNDEGETISEKSAIIRVDKDLVMDEQAQSVHGHTKEKLREDGECLECVLRDFYMAKSISGKIIAHNIQFDMGIIGAEFHRVGRGGIFQSIEKMDLFCTKLASTDICKIPGPHGYKWPKLQELHKFLFGEEFEGAHDAMADIRATKKCFFELKKRNLINV